MIVYNVTVKIENSVLDDWVEWMQKTHIPDVLATNLFEDAQLRKLLIAEDDGTTFSVQYRCHSMEKFNQYQKDFAPSLQREHTERYKDKYVAFRTLMEEL